MYSAYSLNKQACNSKSEFQSPHQLIVTNTSKEAKCHPYHKWSMYNRAYWSKKEKPSNSCASSNFL